MSPPEAVFRDLFAGQGERRDHVILEIISSRLLPAPPEDVFRLFGESEPLARWWVPEGVSCALREFDCRPGGRWRFELFGTDGVATGREFEFVEVAKPRRLVFRSLSGARFSVAIDLVAEDGRTVLTRRLVFDSVAEYEKVKGFGIGSHEQNFDRLEAELARRAANCRVQAPGHQLGNSHQ